MASGNFGGFFEIGNQEAFNMNFRMRQGKEITSCDRLGRCWSDRVNVMSALRESVEQLITNHR